MEQTGLTDWATGLYRGLGENTLYHNLFCFMVFVEPLQPSKHQQCIQI